MNKPNFVHLHTHSDYSLCDSTASVNALVNRAEELGMTHLALTDHGNMFGIMNFLEACKNGRSYNPDETSISVFNYKTIKYSIKPIIGCEVYVIPGSRFEKRGEEKDNQYYHLVLLAANNEGYHNLIKLCSFGYTEGFYYRPRIDEELLTKYNKGLIALSGCLFGEIPILIQSNKIKEAEEKALQYKSIFGNDENGKPNFYLEIQDHGIPIQKEINRAIAEISKRTDIPLVATNDVHYIKQEDADAHDVLLCIGRGKRKSDKDRKKYHGNQYYFKSGEEMTALFSDYPEAITNTVAIADHCNVDVQRVHPKDLFKGLPDFSIPESFENAANYLKHISTVGLKKRYPNEWESIQKRMEYELDTIKNGGCANYFLIVADFINWAKERNIPVGPGRGSGAGSIVAYVLGITNIDPIKYNLLFERFINPLRICLPDFDIDFSVEGRKEVLNYVTEKYGKDKTGQIITFGTFKTKAVIKDVARVLGIPVDETNNITNLISYDSYALSNAIEEEPKLKELKQDSRYIELFKLANNLEGLHRHAAIHAAGFVLSKLPLIDILPLYWNAGNIATQYDMWDLETLGLVKFDFLGLGILDIIKHTEELIRQRGGDFANFNIENIPDNDLETFSLFKEGNTNYVFQFESNGMKEILKQTKPDKMTDLIALYSLYRPGPMQYIKQFIDSKNGKQEIVYPDPCLEDILKETYGIIVYQEQVMLIAQQIAGYSLSEADILRRVLGKKKKDIIEKEKELFVNCAIKNGIKEEQAVKIYDILASFACFSFNKSHSAAYTMLAYQSAYLKAHFPKEFEAACRKFKTNN